MSLENLSDFALLTFKISENLLSCEPLKLLRKGTFCKRNWLKQALFMRSRTWMFHVVFHVACLLLCERTKLIILYKNATSDFVRLEILMNICCS